MRVRVKAKKDIYSKETFKHSPNTFTKSSRRQDEQAKNLNTGEQVIRLYTDEELDITFSQPEKTKTQIIRKQEKPKNSNNKKQSLKDEQNV